MTPDLDKARYLYDILEPASLEGCLLPPAPHLDEGPVPFRGACPVSLSSGFSLYTEFISVFSQENKIIFTLSIQSNKPFCPEPVFEISNTRFDSPLADDHTDIT